MLDRVSQNQILVPPVCEKNDSSCLILNMVKFFKKLLKYLKKTCKIQLCELILFLNVFNEKRLKLSCTRTMLKEMLK